MIGEERWKGYPLWRRSNGKGRGTDARVSDWTIRAEMATFRSIMLFAAGKKYTQENLKGFNMRVLKLGKPRGDAFTLEEYRILYTHARKWVKQGKDKKVRWYREMFQKFMLCMANMGLRPPEARNLRSARHRHAEKWRRWAALSPGQRTGQEQEPHSRRARHCRWLP